MNFLFLIKFVYNNFIYNIIKIIPFFILYSYYPKVKAIKDNNLKRKVFTIYK